jgi:hypothetical protein
MGVLLCFEKNILPSNTSREGMEFLCPLYFNPIPLEALLDI